MCVTNLIFTQHAMMGQINFPIGGAVPTTAETFDRLCRKVTRSDTGCNPGTFNSYIINWEPGVERIEVSRVTVYCAYRPLSGSGWHPEQFEYAVQMAAGPLNATTAPYFNLISGTGEHRYGDSNFDAMYLAGSGYPFSVPGTKAAALQFRDVGLAVPFGETNIHLQVGVAVNPAYPITWPVDDFLRGWGPVDAGATSPPSGQFYVDALGIIFLPTGFPPGYRPLDAVEFKKARRSAPPIRHSFEAETRRLTLDFSKPQGTQWVIAGAGSDGLYSPVAPVSTSGYLDPAGYERCVAVISVPSTGHGFFRLATVVP